MIEIINEKERFRWNDWIDLFLCKEKWVEWNWDLHIRWEGCLVGISNTVAPGVHFLEVWRGWSADIWVLADRPVCLCGSFSPNGLKRWYLKYLTKKYLKKNNLRDWLRVVANSKESYELRYFQINQDEEEEEDED